MGDCGPTAKDSALFHDDDQVVTALEMESYSVCDSVSHQSLLLGYFVGLEKGASMF